MKIPLFKIYWDDSDLKSVNEVIKSGMDWATGYNVGKFEDKLSNYFDLDYAITFSSGTSALHSLMIAYGFGSGDEVIVPSFSFIATANAPLFVGAKPVFADIEKETYGIDPGDVKRKITKKTKAIIAVHYGGGVCKIKELKKIAKENNLILIEDVAEAFGTEVSGKKAGTFGDAAILSFCQNKVFTTGEGGAVITDSDSLNEKLRLIRSHGRIKDNKHFSSGEKSDYVRLGYNLRMSNILAALGVSQIEKVEDIIEMRVSNADMLTKKFSGIREIKTPNLLNNSRHVYQLYTIEANEKRDELKKYLIEKGIATKVYFYPIHLTSFYKNELGFKKKDLPVTEDISEKVLTLPMYPGLTEEEIDYIVKSVKKFLG